MAIQIAKSMWVYAELSLCRPSCLIVFLYTHFEIWRSHNCMNLQFAPAGKAWCKLAILGQFTDAHTNDLNSKKHPEISPPKEMLMEVTKAFSLNTR